MPLGEQTPPTWEKSQRTGKRPPWRALCSAPPTLLSPPPPPPCSPALPKPFSSVMKCAPTSTSPALRLFQEVGEQAWRLAVPLGNLGGQC